MHRGCLVCAICNSNSFCSFIFKLCVMIVHILKICTFYFVHNLWIFSHFLGLLDLDFFPFKMHRGYLVCVISYSNKCFFPYIQTLHIDCAHIEYVHLLFCAQFMNIFSFLGLLDLEFFSVCAKIHCQVCATGDGPIPPCSAHVLRVYFLQASKFYPARGANLIEKMVSIRDIISYSFCFTCISIHRLIHPFSWLLVITHPSISSHIHLSNHHTVNRPKSFPNHGALVFLLYFICTFFKICAIELRLHFYYLGPSLVTALRKTVFLHHLV